MDQSATRQRAVAKGREIGPVVLRKRLYSGPEALMHLCDSSEMTSAKICNLWGIAWSRSRHALFLTALCVAKFHKTKDLWVWRATHNSTSSMGLFVKRSHRVFAISDCALSCLSCRTPVGVRSRFTVSTIIMSLATSTACHTARTTQLVPHRVVCSHRYY